MKFLGEALFKQSQPSAESSDQESQAEAKNDERSKLSRRAFIAGAAATAAGGAALKAGEALAADPHIAIGPDVSGPIRNSEGYKDIVKRLQKFLADQNLYSEDIDGDYGLATEEAVLKFQQAHCQCEYTKYSVDRDCTLVTINELLKQKGQAELL